jgi:hypothetical protein
VLHREWCYAGRGVRCRDFVARGERTSLSYSRQYVRGHSSNLIEVLQLPLCYLLGKVSQYHTRNENSSPTSKRHCLPHSSSCFDVPSTISVQPLLIPSLRYLIAGISFYTALPLRGAYTPQQRNNQNKQYNPSDHSTKYCRRNLAIAHLLHQLSGSILRVHGCSYATDCHG